MRIDYLAAATGAIPELAEAFVAEWEPYYGAEGPGDAVADLTDCVDGHELPVALIALIGESVVGTVALKNESSPTHTHLAPWLAGLLVVPNHRGKGVASALVTACADEARQRGFETLYTTCRPASKLVRGWTPIDDVPTLRGPATVFRLDLL